ncbi:hypothetical protein PFISCL1PPCAC_25820, partial [Pristionchus fissidentatus]
LYKLDVVIRRLRLHCATRRRARSCLGQHRIPLIAQTLLFLLVFLLRLDEKLDDLKSVRGLGEKGQAIDQLLLEDAPLLLATVREVPLDDARARIVQRECEREGRDDGEEGLTARVRRARVEIVQNYS